MVTVIIVRLCFAVDLEGTAVEVADRLFCVDVATPAYGSNSHSSP
ncbi:hypothetical protein QE392_001385 [Microbacterium proteolyticum]|nr:hypothetical protein [Microbacterium proteolyticum]MDQ1169581.1 hypothetical protein [Microbacterium proteolyticum]